MVERIEKDGVVLALILRGELEAEGVNFFTPSNNPLQLGIFGHKKGTEIKPHAHKPSVRTIRSVQEVLHIEYGKVEAHLYSDEEHVRTTILNSGDTILLISGGHGFKILEDSRIIEVKQDPYYGIEDDKKLFRGGE